MGASQFRRGSITDKILSVFFVVVLIISLAPSASYAQDEEVSAVSTEQEEVSTEDAVVNDSSEQGNNKDEDSAKTATNPIVENATYSGLEQTGVTEGEGYTLSGKASAKSAGTYSVTASLKDGYVWADGTMQDKTIEWSIVPAELTATYEGETIAEGSKPSGAVSVKGFVNGETKLIAKDYVAPTVKYPSNLTEGEYMLTPEGGSAANYVFKNVSGVLRVNKVSDVEQLKPGTHTVTSNLYLPGELNTQLPGVTAYLTNPNNPLGQKPDGYTGPFESTAPTTPASDNAQLVVGEDGSLTLTLQVLNPVFTLQNIDNCQNAEVLKVKRDSKTYSDVTGSASRQGRITEITVKLNNNSGSYVFNTCTEFPTLLGVDWNVPLTLDVDFSAVPGYTPAPPSDTVNYAKLNAAIVNAQNAIKNARVSADGSDVDVLDTWVTQGAVDILSKAIEAAKQALANNSQDEVDFAATTLNAATMALSQSAKNGTKVSNGGTSDGNNSGNNSGNNTSDAGQVAVTESGHYAQGTYTVSGNVWFDKSVTGLPLNPHISNGAFPPKDPVSGNATMTVDGSGHAWVSIPVVIQDKVMVVNNVWGSGVSYNGSNVVIDLGTPRAGQTSFNGTCTANITMGALASTISGKSGSYTWSANWAVNFGSASMASGGGTIPAAALAALAGVEGTVDEASAEEAALAALDSDSAKSASGKAKNGSASSEDSNSVLPLIAGIAAAVVCGGAIVAAVAIRRKRSGSQKE